MSANEVVVGVPICVALPLALDVWRNTLYDAAPVAAVQLSSTLLVFVPSVAVKPVGAKSPRRPEATALNALTSVPLTLLTQ